MEGIRDVGVSDSSRVSDNSSDGLRSSKESESLVELNTEGERSQSHETRSTMRREETETYKMRSQVELGSNPNLRSLLPKSGSSELVLVPVVVRLESKIKRQRTGSAL